MHSSPPALPCLTALRDRIRGALGRPDPDTLRRQWHALRADYLRWIEQLGRLRGRVHLPPHERRRKLHLETWTGPTYRGLVDME